MEAVLNWLFLGEKKSAPSESEIDLDVRQRVSETIHVRGDRFMRRYALAHLVISLVLAGFYNTWQMSIAIGLAATLIVFSCTALLPGRFLTRCLIGVALQAFVALHIYQLHGMAEMHFFFFTAFSAMVVYQDSLCMWPGAVLIIGQHLLFALLHNSGVQLYFFEDPYVGFRKLFFHFGIALAHVVLCGYCALLLRRWEFLTAMQHARLKRSESLLATQLQISLQRESALVESEERLQEAQRLARVGSWEVDLMSGELRCTEAVRHILALTKSAPRWEDFLERLQTESREQTERLAQIAGMHGTPFETDQRLVSGVHVNIRARQSEDNPSRLRGTLLDITERKRTEALLRASVAEKELLLQEVHHRVKNNLQVISSLLNMQAETAWGSDRHILLESQRRVHSMALIHEQLYSSGRMDSLDFSEYIPLLMSELFSSHGADPFRIQLNVQVEPMRFDIQTAIPCGLIINELVTNALKYAFPGDRCGRLDVRLRRTAENRVVLEIEDDGPGIPPGFEWRNSSSLGMRIVHILAEQLDGSLTWTNTGGAAAHFEFPHREVKE